MIKQNLHKYIDYAAFKLQIRINKQTKTFKAFQK